MQLLRRAASFCSRVIRATQKKVVGFIYDVFNHTEAVIILVAASVGISSVLAKASFAVIWPAFVEPSMAVTVLAVVSTLLLLRSAEIRMNRRPLTIAML